MSSIIIFHQTILETPLCNDSSKILHTGEYSSIDDISINPKYLLIPLSLIFKEYFSEVYNGHARHDQTYNIFCRNLPILC